jgi:hypothetical protein
LDAFTKNLNKLMEEAGFTVSDLARFLRVPRATTNTWLGGRVPFGPKLKHAEERIALLENSIKHRKKYYPVPDNLSWEERGKYVQGMRDDAERNYSVPNMRAAG